MFSRHYAFLQLRNLAAATTTTNATATNSTIEDSIAPYATKLNGVNQPLNDLFKVILWWSLGVLAMIILITRLTERAKKHYRHMAARSLPGRHQDFWRRNTSQWWKVKKYFIYAPLWNKRHNREIKLSSAINIGTIPSRFHTILLGTYIITNLSYCAALDYTNLNKYAVAAELRGRTGVLAVCNMIALVLLAGRNNPLIYILQISFDTYNLLHRWMGRIVVIESVIHTIAWAYVKQKATGWNGVGSMIASDPFIMWGTVGTAGMILIFLSSPSPIRHAFYETFLNVHIILAFTSMIAVYLHCYIAKLPQIPYIQVFMLLWLLDRLARVLRIVYYNYSFKGKGWTTASIESLPGEACRVTMHLPKYADIYPGSHAYLRFATLNAWESHPFSIAWVKHNSTHTSEKDLEFQCSNELDKSTATTDVSFVIHAQTGLTRRLFDKAEACSPRVLTLKAAFEGPYAGHHSLDSYGHTVLFAGSSGISHQIPYIKRLIQGFEDGTVATRKILLVWIVRDSEHLEWVRPWMDEILRMPRRREILNIKLFVTRPKNPASVKSMSETVQMFPGRPNVKMLLDNEVKSQTGAMCVTVCGPGGLADNVRQAVRDVQESGNVDFIEESFTW